jgi:formylmethanofuran dehydrogenase subunit E
LHKKSREGSITDAEKSELDDLGVQRMTDILNICAEDLFSMAPVTAGMPEKARIDKSTPCSRCGEPTMHSKLESVDGVLVCRGCLA